jgi:hypothetical protein
MFEEELRRKIERLEAELVSEEEKYINAVKSHDNYVTLRAIRNTIRTIKEELQSLYRQQES